MRDDALNARILHPLVNYLARTYGEVVADEVVEPAGLSAERLRKSHAWLSLAQFEAILAAARARMADNHEFRQACVFELRESYGPMILVLRALSVRSVWDLLVRTMPMASRISRYEIVGSKRRSAHLRYVSDAHESRLMCVSRQAQVAFGPTLWGLPQAEIREEGCIAYGDPACNYHLTWHETPALLPVIASGVLGAFLPVASGWLGFSLAGSPGIYATACALVAAVGVLWRTNRKNLEFAEESNESLRKLAREAAQAREELLALSARQEDWSRLMEAEVQERTEMLQRVVDRVQAIRERRVVDIRGISHDLRGPLCALAVSADLLAMEYDEALDDGGTELVTEIRNSVKQIDDMLRALVDTAMTDVGLLRLTPNTLDVASLVERLRRRLRALVLGKDVRVTAFVTREAPTTIETDLLVFDRVVHNLVSNAAKYTERGSIVLEISGKPGFLTVKISDTGPGISGERIEHVFRVPKRDARMPEHESYGVGLSVVVRLLDLLHGRLEVMSQPAVGTTFWARFPTRLPNATARRDSPDESLESVIDRVVSIRRVNGA